MESKAMRGCEILLHTCAAAQPGEKIVVVTDDASREIGELMYACASAFTDTTLVRMPPRNTHGAAPTEAIRAAMSEADILFGATTFSLFNTPARLDACKKGARFVNMADYSEAMLEEGCLFVDFAQARALVEDTAKKILGKQCSITTPAGTNFTTSIEGRKAVSGFGMSPMAGMASSPPNIETAVGPVENSAEGVLIIDGSIPLPGLGVIREPIRINVEKGLIVSIEGGEEAKLLEKSLKAMNDDRVYVIAEVGFGMNTNASISGRMLEDEGVFGTMHIGIGNNLSYGGTNNTPIHIDLIMRRPTYIVDGKTIYRDGEIIG